jgi:hypothetical protein
MDPCRVARAMDCVAELCLLCLHCMIRPPHRLHVHVLVTQGGGCHPRSAASTE